MMDKSVDVGMRMTNKLSCQEGPLAEMKEIVAGDQEPAGLEEKAPQAISPRAATGLVLQFEMTDLGRLHQDRKGRLGRRVNSCSRVGDDRRQPLDMSRLLYSVGRWRWGSFPLLRQSWNWDWMGRRARRNSCRASPQGRRLRRCRKFPRLRGG